MVLGDEVLSVNVSIREISCAYEWYFWVPRSSTGGMIGYLDLCSGDCLWVFRLNSITHSIDTKIIGSTCHQSRVVNGLRETTLHSVVKT